MRCTENQIQRFRVAMIGNEDPWRVFESEGSIWGLLVQRQSSAVQEMLRMRGGCSRAWTKSSNERTRININRQ